MDEFNKVRYSFSLTPALVLVGEEIVQERKRQTEELNAELETYGIILKDLTCDEVSYELRNELLNIAMFITVSAEIYNELYEKRELPIRKISKAVLKPKQFLQKWRDHIIVYSIILGSYNYKYISDYLKIIEKKDDTEETKDNNVISFSNIANFNKSENDDEDIEENIEVDELEKRSNVDFNDEHEKIKGIILYRRKSKAIILTSSGDFKKIKINGEYNLGEEVTSNIKKKVKNKKIYIGILILLMICGVSMGIYKYFKGVTTVVFEADEQITLEINSFNRVVRSKNTTNTNNTILEEVEIQDRDIDTAIYKLIKYCNEEDKITKGQILITVTGDAIKHGILSNTREYVSEEGINVKFNNAGYESSLNSQ